MERLSVTGSGGVRLSVVDFGDRAAPSILFVPGWAQSSLSWRHQTSSSTLADFRLVAMDLRGHGMSEAPREASAYTDPRVWADDIAAIIDQLELRDTVLVGWSHGGFVVADYLDAYGDGTVAGVNFVGWASKMGPTPEEREYIDDGFEGLHAALVSDDLERRVAATRAFVRACTAEPMPRDDYEEALCFNMVVSAEVRRWVALHDACDYAEMVSRLRVPVLVTHGLADGVVSPAAVERILKACPTATASLYPGVGHSPFIESAARFNAELRELAVSAQAARLPRTRPGAEA